MEKSLLMSLWEEYNKLFIETSTFLNERNVEDIKKDFEEGISEIVVCGETCVKGFCILYRDSLDSYHIDYLGVPDRFQGLGLGRDILQYVLENVCFHKQEIETVWLLCKDDKLNFYHRFGFKLEETILIGDQLWNKMVNKKCHREIQTPSI
jgi:N-acetylglutamate synthase-like GNAT family acetyltransferase